jgi:hypothetical protein
LSWKRTRETSKGRAKIFRDLPIERVQKLLHLKQRGHSENNRGHDRVGPVTDLAMVGTQPNGVLNERLERTATHTRILVREQYSDMLKNRSATREGSVLKNVAAAIRNGRTVRRRVTQMSIAQKAPARPTPAVLLVVTTTKLVESFGNSLGRRELINIVIC